MSMDLIGQIANAVLYEGYLLYPYHRSAVKNRQRWNFGVLYPRSYAEAQTGNDAFSMQAECLALGASDAKISVTVRFLQLVNRVVSEVKDKDGELRYEPVDLFEIGGESFESWQEACEREVVVHWTNASDRESSAKTIPFTFSSEKTQEILRDGEKTAGVITRINETVHGEISLSVERESDSIFKVRVLLTNRAEFDDKAESRDLALMKSLLSAHAIVSVKNAEFVSLLDPPPEFQASASACRNVGCWPVLVGAAGERDTMLASPIILYDYPQVAAESAGNLFDGTEIDEILSLRIMTLTDDEKRQMRTSDERAREILRRTEEMPAEQFMKLHGVLRNVDR